MNQPDTLPQTGFLRIAQVLQLIPVARSTWWQGVRDGRYPASVVDVNYPDRSATTMLAGGSGG